MINIDTSNRIEQRKFGFVMAAAIAIIGCLRWALHGFAGFPVYFLVTAAVFFIPAFIYPFLLKPVFDAWIKLALVLNWIMTRVFLAFAFYLLITPVRLVLLVFSDDPLKRKWSESGTTYWEEPEEQPEEFERYRNQF